MCLVTLWLWTKEQGMEDKMTGEALKAALGVELDALLLEVAKTMNQARPGKIIADSEEGVRDAAAEFRRRLYEKALELRQKQDGAFSPSAGTREVAQQGAAGHQLPDGQRPSGVPQDDLLEPRPRKRRAR
jgi:hypothetical protein